MLWLVMLLCMLKAADISPSNLDLVIFNFNTLQVTYTTMGLVLICKILVKEKPPETVNFDFILIFFFFFFLLLLGH